MEVHHTTAAGLKVSPSGKQIGIMTSDGFIKVLKSGSEEFIVSEKRHRLPVTCMGFKTDSNGNAEYLLCGSPDYTYNIIRCKESFISKPISNKFFF